MNERTKELLKVLRDHADCLLRNPSLHPDGNPDYIKIIADQLKEANKGEEK